MISFFLERTRRKVRSFWGSMSRMVVLAFISSWWISPAYWTVLVLSRVVLMGIPEGKKPKLYQEQLLDLLLESLLGLSSDLPALISRLSLIIIVLLTVL